MSHTKSGGPWCNDPSSLKSSLLRLSPRPLSLPIFSLNILNLHQIYPKCLSLLRKLSIVFARWFLQSELLPCHPPTLTPSTPGRAVTCETMSSVLTSSTVIFAKSSLPLSCLLWVSSWSADVVLISWSTSYWLFWDGSLVSFTPCMWLSDEFPAYSWQMLTILQLHYLQILEIPTSHTSSQPTLSKTNIPCEMSTVTNFTSTLTLLSLRFE